MDTSRPLVLPVDLRPAERRGTTDLYLPDDLTIPRPLILIVPGGPLPADFRPTPRDWPLYRGYGSLLAARGAVAAVVDHPRLHSPADFPAAADDLRTALDELRADPRTDADRVALWFFSGGALLAAPWLREVPAWLRGVALTYPLLTLLPGWEVDPAFRPAEAVTHATGLPIVLTRVGQENPAIAAGIPPFVDAAAKARLEIIDVPDGRHVFDVLDDTDASRAAITRAVDAVLATVDAG